MKKLLILLILLIVNIGISQAQKNDSVNILRTVIIKEGAHLDILAKNYNLKKNNPTAYHDIQKHKAKAIKLANKAIHIRNQKKLASVMAIAQYEIFQAKLVYDQTGLPKNL